MDAGLKFGTLGHSLLAIGAVIFYLISFFSPVKIAVSYSVAALIFLGLSIVVNLSSFCLASNKKVKSFYQYFLILQVILCVAFAITGGITINREKVEKEINKEVEKYIEKYGSPLGILKLASKLHQSLKCCSANDAGKGRDELIFSKMNEMSKIGDPTPDDLKKYQDSCCDGEIAKDDFCTPSHEKYYTSTCRDALDRKVNLFKYCSIAIFVLSAICQCFLSFGFYKSAQSEA